jgi:hypothetical protein
MLIAKELESAGKIGNLVAVDGSPLLIKTCRGMVASVADDSFPDAVLRRLRTMEYPDKQQEILQAINEAVTWEEKLESFVKLSNSDMRSTKKYSKNLIVGLINRLVMTQTVDLDSFPSLDSTEISVVVPSQKLLEGFFEDLGFSQYTNKKVQSSTVQGNHLTVISSPELFKLLE